MNKKTVLLLDEGAESGYKLLCALKTILAMNPKAVYMAVPVLPRDLNSFAISYPRIAVCVIIEIPTTSTS